ncbi:hypothetical protein ABAC402_10285 [Asticcacaulis sp. AC402]|nr:hypothetical protein ABAC402_10285 [Asticcacaulis sp. AC402]
MDGVNAPGLSSILFFFGELCSPGKSAILAS